MTFSKVKGQKRADKILGRFLEAARVPSAMLFVGLEGVGKTLMAFEFAKALLCKQKQQDGGPCGKCSDCASIDKGIHPDIKAVNDRYQASFRNEEAAKQKTLRADTIRHLRKDMEMRSMLGGWKVAILEDAHTLELEAANALLKVIEEPPPRTLWILITSQKERLLKTVQSRCFTVSFAPLADTLVEELLIAVGMDAQRAARFAPLGEGSVGRALEHSLMPDSFSSLEENPLGAILAADALPRELYLSRVQVESALFSLAQNLRRKQLEGSLDFSRIERPLRRLLRLRQALKANADPKLILTLAGEAVNKSSTSPSCLMDR